ncbi:MAG: hypothetical protein ACI8QF_001737, partial [Limisphaerales bacterium]
LAERYELGDKVYLMGFSRGAYAGRSLRIGRGAQIKKWKNPEMGSAPGMRKRFTRPFGRESLHLKFANPAIGFAGLRTDSGWIKNETTTSPSLLSNPPTT